MAKIDSYSLDASITDNDSVLGIDSASGATKRFTMLSMKTYIASEADITAVIAGTGLSGGATSGDATLSIDSTVATLTGTQTLTNKSIDLTNNTLTGTLAEFNTALSDATFTSLTGAETLTNKTIDVDNNTISNLEVDNLKAGVLDTDLTSVSASDDTLASAKAIKTYVDSNITAQDLDITDGATTSAVDLDSQTLTIQGTSNEVEVDLTGQTFTIGLPDNVTIAGDLTVNGTTTTINTQTLSVEDPLIEMANQNAANTVDTGFYANYSLDAGVTTKYAGLFKDASDSDTFKLFKGLEVEPTTSVDTAGTGYTKGDLVVNDLDAVTISGNLTGSVLTAAQTNITSVGTLSSLTVGGAVNVNNANINLSNAYNLTGRNNADTLNISLIGRNTSDNVVIDADGYGTKIGSQGLLTVTSTSVGIGTSSPSAKLQVSSTSDTILKITSADGNGAFLDLGDASDTDGGRIVYDGGSNLAFYTASTERVRIKSNGNVGIGTTSPDQLLDVQSDSSPTIRITNSKEWGSSDSGTVGQLEFYTTDASTPNGTKIAAFIKTTNNAGSVIPEGELSFGTSEGSSGSTNAVERMRIDSSGNVGIGTTSPASTLEISKNDQTNGATLSITNSFDGTDWNSGDTVGTINFRVDDGSTTEKIRGQIKLFNDSSSGTTYPAYNAMSFSTANLNTLSERMRIDSSGNVGIGTTTPNYLLDVEGSGSLLRVNSTSGNSFVQLSVPDTTSITGVTFGDSLSSFAGYIWYRHNGDSMAFATAGSEAMRINSSGNVGIGTTSPDANAKLDVYGGRAYFDATNEFTIRLSDSGTIGGFIGTPASGALGFYSSTGTERMRINSSGNVGIGTTSPVSLLDLGSGSTSGDGLSFGTTQTEIRRGNSGADLQISHWGDVSVIIDSDNNDSATREFKIMEGSTDAGTANELFRVTSGGKVGIGTSSPASILDIQSNSSLTIRLGNSLGINGYQLKSNVSSSDDFGFVIEDYSGTDLYQIQAGSGGFHRFLIDGSEKMRITSAGNVGINVIDPDSQLEIVNSSGGSYRLGYAGGTDSYFDSENFYIRSGSGGSNKFVVNASGNVGIGTTSPVATLDVRGDSLFYANSGETSLQITATSSNNTEITFGSFGATGNVAKIIGNSGGLGLIFNTNNAERLRIDSSGRVGIGTTSPTQGNLVISPTAQAADLDGLVLAYNPDGGSNRVRAQLYIDAFNGMLDLKSGSDILTTRISSAGNSYFNNGNVGIGTTSPVRKLDVDSGTLSDIVRFGNNNGSMTFGQSAGLTSLDLDTSNAYRIRQGASVPFYIKSDGNVGIGTTSPTVTAEISSATIHNQLRVHRNISGDNTTMGAIALSGDDSLGNVTDYARIKGLSESDNTGSEDGAIVFETMLNASLSERMRITSGGSVLIDTTDNTPNGVTISSAFVSINDGTRYAGHFATSTTSSATALAFSNPNGLVGSIETNGSATSFNTSSDYRLKENVVPMEGALDRVDALKPSRFNFIADADKTVDGFLAHEVAEVVPEAISGEKDAVDEEGNAIYQGIDQSKLVPLLVGAIKELRAEINNLKQQINK